MSASRFSVPLDDIRAQYSPSTKQRRDRSRSPARSGGEGVSLRQSVVQDLDASVRRSAGAVGSHSPPSRYNVAELDAQEDVHVLRSDQLR